VKGARQGLSRSHFDDPHLWAREILERMRRGRAGEALVIGWPRAAARHTWSAWRSTGLRGVRDLWTCVRALRRSSPDRLPLIEDSRFALDLVLADQASRLLRARMRRAWSRIHVTYWNVTHRLGAQRYIVGTGALKRDEDLTDG
jgi:hypothetical protein